MSFALQVECSGTMVDDPPESTVSALFEQQAARTPDAIALAAGAVQLSYRELDERSNRLARHLQRLGVEPDTLVGVWMERSETLVIGLLAILKAGGAYLPLDPGYPRERLSLLIEDSGIPLLLTTAKSSAGTSLAGQFRVVDADAPAVALEDARPVASPAAGCNLAYMIYTSGSTGRPKGVMVEHRNVVNFFRGMDRAIGYDAGVWLAVTSISFDISVLELLWTLTRGFKVVLHGDEGPATIAAEIARHNVTHLQMTPSLARMLTLDSRAFAALGSLRQILLGGEAVPAALLRHLRQVFKGEMHNMYGPTETTIWSTTYWVEEIASTVPIGSPIVNTQIYILNEALEPVPQGEPGELFIGGEGVARGYWNRPEQTAERFVSLPRLAAQPIYRTGDLVRQLPDGNLEFLGRADFQIKLRGHRIEPGEIEAAIERIPGVRQAVIVAREDREGDKRLVAYIVADGTVTAGALRRSLDAILPDFMVPSGFVFVPEMPLTSNGKIDRKALLALPPPDPSVEMGGAQPAAGPENQMQQIVAGVWQQALGLPRVGLHDNFFDLGAHSLTVAEAHSRLQQLLGREIALLDLFQYSTVSALADHLAGIQQLSKPSDRALRRRLARQG